MKADYQELIKTELFDKEWTPQGSILSAVARKRHGIARSGDKKKGAVLIALKAMLRKGQLKKAVDEDGNVFWGKRLPGEETINFWNHTKIQLDFDELTKLNTARKNIERLEEALQDIFSDIFRKAYKNDWEDRINTTTFDMLKTTYWKSKRINWKHGGQPEELFSVAGIKDFAYLLGDKGNRELFKQIFPNTFIITAKLTELAEYRNKIQHNEHLSKEEYIYFNIASQLLLQTISELK